MVFSSIEFIFVFMPIFLCIYYLTPERFRNVCLLLGSLLFYGIGSAEKPEYILFFMASLMLNYLFGILIDKSHGKLWFPLGVATNVLYLVVCKYFLRVLPIGISFYTFQAISYLCDVHRKKCRAESSFLHYGVYLSMFPQLVAGPIVQFRDICHQIHKRTYNFHSILNGLRVFILGLGSKVILANRVGGLWSQLTAIGYESISTPLAWLGLFAYSFQIYFDFLGYSLMAIGLGSMLGFDLPVNFDNPYLSTSMTEFWRRWHITLGSWFREYVYIPLGGNQKGKLITYRNLFVVWLLTGIWHGASYNFVLWGLLLFVVITVERAGLKQFLDRYPILGHLYMLLLIPLSWAVFANTDWNQLQLFFGRLFGADNMVGYGFQGDFVKYGQEYGVYLILCLLFVVKLPQKIWTKLQDTGLGQIVLVGIFAGSVYFLYKGINNPFLYYQF